MCGFDRIVPGFYHCCDCDLCCYKLDHHCMWMGKCIGFRTLLFFKSTLILVVVFMVVATVVPMVTFYYCCCLFHSLICSHGQPAVRIHSQRFCQYFRFDSQCVEGHPVASGEWYAFRKNTIILLGKVGADITSLVCACDHLLGKERLQSLRLLIVATITKLLATYGIDGHSE